MTQKRSSVAARELQAARRKRHHRQVIRNRIIFGIACLALLALIIFGIVKLFGLVFGGFKQAEVSTLHFNEDGTVTFEEITDFDEGFYDKKEFKDYTNDLIQSFNETMGTDAIILDKLLVDEGQAYVRTTYSSADIYTAFTSYVTFSDTVNAASEAGYAFDDIIVSVMDGQKGDTVEYDSAAFFGDYKVAIVKQNANVTVPGNVYYVSAYNTKMVDSSTVEVTNSDENDDETALVYIIFSDSPEDSKKSK